jgi:hypothetical protein
MTPYHPLLSEPEFVEFIEFIEFIELFCSGGEEPVKISYRYDSEKIELYDSAVLRDMIENCRTRVANAILASAKNSRTSGECGDDIVAVN